MVPTPAPAPPIPMHAMPAPMYFAATGSMIRTPIKMGVYERTPTLMARVESFTEIDAREDGKHVGLKHRHQEVERSERHHHDERHSRPQPADDADRAQHGDEAGKHRQRDVAGEHVGEQPNAV